MSIVFTFAAIEDHVYKAPCRCPANSKFEGHALPVAPAAHPQAFIAKIERALIGAVAHRAHSRQPSHARPALRRTSSTSGNARRVARHSRSKFASHRALIGNI